MTSGVWVKLAVSQNPWSPHAQTYCCAQVALFKYIRFFFVCIATASLPLPAEDTSVCGSITRADVADLVVKALRR